MGADTKIQWADHTFNHWRGCQKIAPGCANCYAETLSKRNPATLGVWGPRGTRVVASETMWREPLKWDREAAKTGEYPRVFCASLADVFEDWQGQCRMSDGGWCVKHRQWGELTGYGSCALAGGNDAVRLDDVRARLAGVWDATPNLDWLVLTKRPENIRRMLPIKAGRRDAIKDGKANVEAWHRPNVWLGVSIACQDDADRLIPELLKCRDLCAKTFLSIEPLIGPIDLSQWLKCECRSDGYSCDACTLGLPDWVIVGGESGPNARPCDVAWIRSIVRQCSDADVPCFVKQVGTNAQQSHGEPLGWPERTRLRDKKGGDPAEWPEDLRVREVPS